MQMEGNWLVDESQSGFIGGNKKAGYKAGLFARTALFLD